MKKIFTVLIAVLLLIAGVSLPRQASAQSPLKMSYQVVIRDVSNALVASTAVGMKISILQGSATGTLVYTETQTPFTNANGLVSIEIGGGTGFDTIGWVSGPYFIKTETDPTGGTNYTVTGTSQLLSVPYALFAKTSGGIGGKHYIGELYGGGVVFYVDQTGSHGLICSMIDVSTSQAWSNVSSVLIGAAAQSDWDGQGNTNAIIGQSGHTSSAAKLCNDYTNANYGTGVYSDWFLPTPDELNLLYNAKRFVNKTLDSDGNAATTVLAKISYWSSYEYNAVAAWYFYFSLGYAGNSSKSVTNYVRAIRAF